MFNSILIAIPTNAGITPETFKSIYNLDRPANCTVDFQFFYGYRVDQVRNLIAKYAIDHKFDYVLFVDHDMILPHDALVRLYEADKDVIGSLYIQRIEGEHNLEVYGFDGRRMEIADIFLQGLMEVGAVGFGCTLVSTKVMKSVEYPQFEYHPALDHSNTVSEDYDFCQKARASGKHIWVHASVKCGHIGKTVHQVVREIQIPVEEVPDTRTSVQLVADQDLLPASMREYLAELPAPSVIYDIGACVGHWSRHAKAQWPSSKIFMFDASHSVVPVMEATGNTWWCGVLTDEDRRLVEFYEDPLNLGGNSYYKETTGAYKDVKPRREIGWTLDTVREHYNWPYPDLIKIDVQGAELDVLRGAINTLAYTRDIIVESQHEAGQYNEGGSGFDDVHKFLTQMGFQHRERINRSCFDADYHYVNMRMRRMSYK